MEVPVVPEQVEPPPKTTNPPPPTQTQPNPPDVVGEATDDDNEPRPSWAHPCNMWIDGSKLYARTFHMTVKRDYVRIFSPAQVSKQQ